MLNQRLKFYAPWANHINKPIDLKQISSVFPSLRWLCGRKSPCSEISPVFPHSPEFYFKLEFSNRCLYKMSYGLPRYSWILMFLGFCSVDQWRYSLLFFAFRDTDDHSLSCDLTGQFIIRIHGLPLGSLYPATVIVAVGLLYNCSQSSINLSKFPNA